MTLQEITEEDVRDMLRSKVRRYDRRKRSQGDLAKAIGISDQMLSMVLTGVKKPSAKVLKYLGVKRETNYWVET